jgi:hypothetical protein
MGEQIIDQIASLWSQPRKQRAGFRGGPGHLAQPIAFISTVALHSLYTLEAARARPYLQLNTD